MHDCDVSKFNRKDIERFYVELCDLIEVERGDLEWWDYEGFLRNLWWRLFHPEELKKNAPSHVKGTTAVQFILTSSVVIHALDDLKNFYINIFSCESFDVRKARQFTRDYFSGTIIKQTELERV